MQYGVAGICLAAALGVGGTGVHAEWITGLPADVDLKPRQLFAIHTSGFPAAGQDPISEFGTGFAIADRVIITAKHVTLAARDFRSSASNPTLHLPQRQVELTFPEDEARNAASVKNADVWVTASPVVTTDASRLDLDTLEADPLGLSVCDIRPGDTYYLLKFRQNRGGAAKNINVPVAIPIRADFDITAREGSLRRFEIQTPMMDDNLNKPIGGDSGSPILDSQGRVIGLLTALQGNSYLWVTPTSSFLDLVPPDRRALVACNPDVTFADLDQTEESLRSDLAGLQTLVATLQTTFASQMTDMQGALSAAQSRIAELEAEVTTLEAEADALEVANTKLKATDKELRLMDELLDKEIADTDTRSTTVLTAMLLKAEERGQIPKDVIKDALNQLLIERGGSQPAAMAASSTEEFDRGPLMEVLGALFEQEPVLPAINRMKADLGEETWGFSVTPNVAGLDRPLFNIGYERGISLPLIASEMVFCMRPLFDFADGVDHKEHSKLDYKNFNFYATSEEIFTTGSLLTICERDKELAGATKAATYSFQIETDPLFNPTKFPELDMNAAPSRYYGYAFDRNQLRRNPENVPIMHRFVLEVDQTADSQEIACYYFDEGDIFKAGDALAEFVSFEDPADKEIYACPTL